MSTLDLEKWLIVCEAMGKAGLTVDALERALLFNKRCRR